MTATALESPRFRHSDEVVRLVARFEDGTLALPLVRDGIKRVNAAHGVPATPTAGYHETITRFYMRAISAYLLERKDESGGDWAARVNRLLQRYGGKDPPLRHYTKDRLMSAEARFGWVEPDLRPIG